MLVRQCGINETQLRNYLHTLNPGLKLLSTHTTRLSYEHTHKISMSKRRQNPTKLHKHTLGTLSYHSMLPKHQCVNIDTHNPSLARVIRGGIMISKKALATQGNTYSIQMHTNTHQFQP